MKLCKLNQGSTFENLKHFIYLTNEYGVPSDEFVDAFIDQFGKIILNGNFTLTQNQIKQLDELWNDIVKDCINNNVEYKENYSSLFYTVLSTKALDKIKEGWEQPEWNQLNEQDRLELLKQFITDFDNHIQDGIDMQQLYFENTPELIKIDEDGNEYIEVKYIYKKSISATGRLYRDSSLVVLSGSQLDEFKNSASNTVIKLRQTYSQHIDDKHTTKDIKCKSPSMAANLVYGGSSNGFTDWVNTRGSQIDLYRWKSNQSNNEVKIDKRAEDAARLNNLINENTDKQKYNYVLTNKRYIGHELTITESVDDIQSSYKVKVVDNVNVQLTDTNLIIDINKFIEEIENRNVQLTITMGFFKFEDIYMEEK